MNAAAIALLLAWTLFAFGGVYPWAFIPSLALCVIGALTTRGRVRHGPGARCISTVGR